MPEEFSKTDYRSDFPAWSDYIGLDVFVP